MKKLLLLANLVLGLATASQAQTFVSQKSTNGDSAMGTVSGATVQINNYLKSSTSTPVKVTWRIVANSGNFSSSSWALDALCDNLQCPDNSSGALLNGATYTTDTFSTQFEDFHTIFNASKVTGNSTAWIQVSVVDANNAGSRRTMTFVATKSSQGVSGYRSDDAVTLYPNPATDAVNVVFDERAGVKNIAIYNLIGQPVSVFHVAGNSANLPLGDAPAGVYFVRLLDGQGHILSTRRFTKQ